MKTIYDFSNTINDTFGNPIDLSSYQNKKILIVNTASECGYTPQYAQLQELYENCEDQLMIIGCPCNQFGNQEPGNAEAIQQFCSKNYGVTFLISEKVDVIGEGAAPLFRYLTQKKLNGAKDTTIEWNFFKFLMNEQGQLIDSFASAISPLEEEILHHFQL